MTRRASESIYHSFLRVAALTCALVLLFESGLVSQTTSQLSHNAGSYMANAVGVTVGVAPTELNMVTAQLTQKETELAAREAALVEREIAVNLNAGNAPSNSADYSTYILSTILFILLVLIVLNYALDFMRAQPRKANAAYEQVAQH